MPNTVRLVPFQPPSNLLFSSFWFDLARKTASAPAAFSGARKVGTALDYLKFAIVEKHMTRSMDAEGNHKMDWFFNQYVYGIGEPQYNFHSTLDYTADGKTHFKVELTRTGVPETWKDVIPLYAHVGDKTIKMGNMTVTHPTETVDTTIPGKIDRISINDYEDLLAEVKQ